MDFFPTIINNYGLNPFPDGMSLIGSNGSRRSKKDDDDDSLDTFKELTKTIEEIIGSLPQITIPSTIVGKGRMEGLKEILKIYKTRDLSKVCLLSCTMVNLIARHSGNKEISKVAGFLQNCLALYTIGDNFCSHITFNWDYCDTMYMSANSAIPGGIGITMEKFRSYCEKMKKRNNDSLTLTYASLYAMVNLMHKEHEDGVIKWFSSIDQAEHTIEPLRTNIKSATRKYRPADPDDDDDEGSSTLCYEYAENAKIGTEENPSLPNAVFELKFDNVRLFIIQNVSASTDGDGSFQYYYPAREVRYFWYPVDGSEMKPSEVNALNENISRYLDMLFINNIDSEQFMFTFDEDGDLVELLRPKAIPEKYVSDRIPHIIKAIGVLHDKKLSRCYALVGQPGTGKTIGAQQISNAFPNVCTFKITSQVVENEDIMNAMLRYVKAVNRCIIILDDMDSRSLAEKNDAVCSYLKFFDNLNQAAKNDQVSYVFIATINDPSKINKVIMCRSGRIDEMEEIGYPQEEALRYLFQYNDNIVNPDMPTDFSKSEFEPEIKFAMDSQVTAADIGNLFADMVIYGSKDEPFTPQQVHDAIERINKRNSMASNNYMSELNDMSRNAYGYKNR